MNEAFQRIVSRMSASIQQHLEWMTEDQLAQALEQAVKCGDFERRVMVSDPCKQAVTYMPNRLHDQLQRRIAELEAQVKRLSTPL